MSSKETFALLCAVAAAAAALFAAGCVPARDAAVATVDGAYEITAGDVKYYYGRGLAAGRWPADATLEETLNDILQAAITGKVLELEAEARGYADDPLVRQELAAAKSQALRDHMWRRVENAVTVTPAEVFDFYERGRKRRMYSFIEIEDPARGEEAYRALEAGRRWEDVVREYSTFQNYAGAGGKWDVPMEYAGDAAGDALFALQVGAYTPLVEDAEGFVWRIYRCDKIVHGSGLTFYEAKADIERVIRNRKARDDFAELARGWRRAAPVKRNDELWRKIFEAPFAELKAEYAGKDAVLADVGGVPVYFDAVLALVERFALLPPEGIDRMREAKPYRYKRMWEGLRRQFEDQALLEYRALREGVDELPSFRREMAARRGELLLDLLYRDEFLAKVPEPTPDDVRAYYEAHKEDFYTPERVEVYLAAMPDEVELRRFYGEIKAGADLVVAGEARNRAREKAAQELYEPPPPLPAAKQEWLGVVAVAVDPALPNAPPEPPFAAELRPRVFPFGKLNALSEVFRLRDGRWAFYEPIYHQPLLQRGLDDAEVAYFCRKALFEETIRSPAVSDAADEWLRSLRARHEVVVDDSALASVAADLRREFAR